MSDLGDMIKGAGDAHAAALGARGDEAATTRMVSSIRRRRVVRASATGLVAAAAVGAVGMTAMAALGPDTSGLAPAGDGVNAWCDLDSYPLPNVDAIPDAGFQGRLYADFASDTYMYRTVDGELRQLEQDDDGVWRDPETGNAFDELQMYEDGPFAAWGLERAVFDVTDSNGFTWVEDPADLYYEWTTTVPATAPDEVSIGQLTAAHETVIFHGGTGISESLGGEGAVIEQLVTRTDGSEEVARVLIGEIPQDVEDLTDLASVTTRVTTAEGETAEVVSTYDASQTYEAKCGENTSEWQDEMAAQDAEASASAEADREQLYLDGPEVEVFACEEPLDPELEAEPVWEERRSGIYDDEEEGMQIDYGDGATVLALPNYGETFDDYEQYDGYTSKGWGGAYGYDQETGEPTTGYLDYLLEVFVDQDGVIVGYSDPSSDDDTFNVWGGSGTTPQQVHVFDSAERIACGDATDEELAAATPVLLTGYGASVDTMEWAWYEVIQD
ncbi:hypothetical protein [Demequina salsinemoris]|uniref:hypothetical protein n=1 Tax=Demequina salsinemoris TaxID=577470 RepID=UPI000781059A|nr:hypothetical protein [Demequina salsinemoris]